MVDQSDENEKEGFKKTLKEFFWSCIPAEFGGGHNKNFDWILYIFIVPLIIVGFITLIWFVKLAVYLIKG